MVELFYLDRSLRLRFLNLRLFYLDRRFRNNDALVTAARSWR
jgi:hypothetical protein